MQFGAARACRALRDDPAQCVRAYAGDACAGDVDGVQGMMDGHCIAEVWSNWRYEHIHANLRFTTPPHLNSFHQVHSNIKAY